jgi:hypothetical protein
MLHTKINIIYVKLIKNNILLKEQYIKDDYL